MSEFIYVSDDKTYTVEISSDLFEDILHECMKSNDYETGGILIGKYSEDMKTALIRSISKAPTDSKSGRASFKRGIIGLLDVLNKKWDESGEYYLGEWHFHPNSTSQPSGTDARQMKSLSKNKRLKCPEPILLIVGGNKNLGWDISVHVYQNGKDVELFQVNTY